MTFKVLFSSLLSFLVFGCSTVYQGSTQDITITTPGAQNAQCLLVNDHIRHQVKAGEKTEIYRSPQDLTVTCMAPGGREKTVLIQRGYDRTAGLNVLNGLFPGALTDQQTRALYRYPERVIVDFTNVKLAQPMMPQAQAKDLALPNLRAIEYYGPAEPLNENTLGVKEVPLKKKTFSGQESNPFAETTAGAGN